MEAIGKNNSGSSPWQAPRDIQAVDLRESDDSMSGLWEPIEPRLRRHYEVRESKNSGILAI